jgi:site-specific recombinase XerD
VKDHEIELNTAVEQYLNDLADDVREETIIDRRAHLSRWMDWLENRGITTIPSTLIPRLDEYEEHLTSHLRETTVRAQMATLTQFQFYIAFNDVSTGVMDDE